VFGNWVPWVVHQNNGLLFFLAIFEFLGDFFLWQLERKTAVDPVSLIWLNYCLVITFISIYVCIIVWQNQIRIRKSLGLIESHLLKSLSITRIMWQQHFDWQIYVLPFA
jgi:hypothetical protein